MGSRRTPHTRSRGGVVLHEERSAISTSRGGQSVSTLRFPSIIGLLLCCGPSAIIRRIRTVIVRETIQRMTRGWTPTHVFQEPFKAVQPDIADSNATPAIGFEVRTFSVVTPIFHAFPCVILDCFTHTMRAISFRYSFFLKAAAGKSPYSDVVLADDFFCPTIAPTQPITMFSTPLNIFTQNKQSAKTAFRQVLISTKSHVGII